ncbi:hypothetical protein ACMFMF_009901 [Clarireedia jacksonii]
MPFSFRRREGLFSLLPLSPLRDNLVSRKHQSGIAKQHRKAAAASSSPSSFSSVPVPPPSFLHVNGKKLAIASSSIEFANSFDGLVILAPFLPLLAFRPSVSTFVQ